MKSIADISIHESGNGGDLEISNNDIVVTESLFNQVYLALFGGNPGHLTTGNELDSEQRFDWWGNSALFGNFPDIQFNSYTENLLNNTELSSKSVDVIKGFVEKDLLFLGEIAKVDINVYILSDNRVELEIKLTKLENLEDKDFQFIWDATKKEVITKNII